MCFIPYLYSTLYLKHSSNPNNVLCTILSTLYLRHTSNPNNVLYTIPSTLYLSHTSNPNNVLCTIPSTLYLSHTSNPNNVTHITAGYWMTYNEYYRNPTPISYHDPTLCKPIRIYLISLCLSVIQIYTWHASFITSFDVLLIN